MRKVEKFEKSLQKCFNTFLSHICAMSIYFILYYSILFQMKLANDEAPSPNQFTPPYADASPYEGGAPIITKQPQKQEEQHDQALMRGAGDTTTLCCCVICLATGGLSLPVWLCWCLIAWVDSGKPFPFFALIDLMHCTQNKLLFNL